MDNSVEQQPESKRVRKSEVIDSFDEAHLNVKRIFILSEAIEELSSDDRFASGIAYEISKISDELREQIESFTDRLRNHGIENEPMLFLSNEDYERHNLTKGISIDKTRLTSRIIDADDTVVVAVKEFLDEYDRKATNL